LIGGYYSDIFTFLELRVELCSGKDYCATPDQIIEYLDKGNQVNMLLSYGYVDLNDYVRPVKNLLDDSLWVPFEAQRRTEVNVFIESSELRSRDSRYLLEIIDDVHRVHNKNKIDTKSYPQHVGNLNGDNRHVRIFFRMSSMHTIYVRNVATLFDMLGEVGGILSIFYSFFLVVTKYYAHESMLEHFMTKLYRFKTHM